MRATAGVAVILVIPMVVMAGVGGGSPIMSGTATARFETAPTTLRLSYRNFGFSQEVVDNRMTVRVDAEASRWSRTAFSLPEAAGERAIARFAVRAARGSRTRAEAVARVLHAVAGQVAYQADANAPSEPEEVLAMASGGCVGRSNLAVAALLELKVPARIARGLLFDAATGAATPHRWIEVYYPDCGWVFSDPTESIHYVSPLHVVLTPPSDPDPSYSAATAVASQPRLLDVTGALYAVDLHPGRESRLSERRNAGAQYAATVYGRVHGSGPWTMLLSGQGQERAVETHSSMFSFPGLRAGAYWLEGRSGGEVRRMALRVSDSELLRLDVREP